MTYIAAARISDVAPGTMKSMVVEGKKILLAHVDGAFYAMQQKCPHLGANLCKGKLNGKVVTCWLHGASFDVTDGTVVNPAKLLIFTMNPKGPATYPVKVENGEVLIGV